jgi:hypothetical protein
MLLDLIAVLFIVGLSLILCRNDKDMTCNISHIVIGLSGIVFYKLVRILKIKKAVNEPFDTSSELASFIAGTSNIVGNDIPTPDQLKSVSNAELMKYNNKLDTLINSINNLSNQMTNNDSSKTGLNPDNIQKLDLESQQQYQMFQLDYLNKQLQNAQDTINAQTLASTSSNYKPIKVFSSCIIANADGTTSIDKPVANNSSSNNGLTTGTAGITGTGTRTVSGSGSYDSNSGIKKQFLDLSPSTGVFNNFLNNLAEGKGNININF